MLVTAALGGTLSADGATLTFAPGSLRADAWVTMVPRNTRVPGLLATSAVYDLHALDARSGAVISTFAIAPVLTISVPAGASRSAVYYLAADGTLQRQNTRYDAAAGVLTSALPHFSSYVAGSPLAGVIGWLVPALEGLLAGGTGPIALGNLDLGNGISLTGVSLTVSALSGSVTSAAELPRSQVPWPSTSRWGPGT